MSMFRSEQDLVSQKLTEFCQRTGLPVLPFQWVPIPFAGQWGISTSFFAIASQEARNSGLKVNVPVRAQEIALSAVEALGVIPGFDKIEAIKGYLNITFNTPQFVHRVVNDVLQEGNQFGKGSPNHEKVMVEYATLNTHKSFHVGHLRNVILGATLCEMLDFAGYDVVRVNYMGDIGAHVIKWLWNYIKRHNGETPPANSVRWMGDMYAEADNFSREDPDAEAEIKALFARWDAKDPEVIDLWQKTRQWSLDGFEKMFAILGARFDRFYFPSEEEADGKKMVADLIQRGIAVDGRPEEAVFVKLDEILGEKSEKFRVLVILRSDGTSLYATTDLSLAVRKFAEYDLARSIYLVDVRQSLYFQQLFKTLEVAGYPWAKDKCIHLGYEIVNLPGNVTMASRDGTVVLLEDLLREATARAIQVVHDKNPGLSPEDSERAGTAVALGAIKYSMINRDNNKIVTFDWQEALNFDGQAAPYIQYAHVRSNSILRKVDFKIPAVPSFDVALQQNEIVLIDLISRFSMEVQRAAAELKPLYITNYAFRLAQAFNDFYNQSPVLQAEEPLKSARLCLVAATRQTLANALAVMGITAPEVM